MDHESFDRVARLLAGARSRRAALGALLGAGLLGEGTAAQRRQRRRAKRRAQAQAITRLRQCPNPGPGQNLSRCDFVGQDLRGTNLSGAGLRRANFAGADLCGVALSGASLANVDFAFANLTRADLRGTSLSSANLDGASLCRTRMPDGSRDDSGCPPAGTDVCCADAECADGMSCHFGRCLLGDCEACSVNVTYFRTRFQYCMSSFYRDCDRCTDWLSCVGELDTQTSCGTVEESC